MKFTYIAAAFMATLASAQPLSLQEQYPEDYASGHVTGETSPNLIDTPLVQRDIEPRIDSIFTVFQSPDCTGGSITITVTGSGVKDNLGNEKKSVRITQLTNNWHLSLYTGRQQTGVLTRFGAREVGASKCYTGSWLSYGVYKN